MTHRHSSPPSPLDGLDPTLRDAYLAGRCTPAERRAVDAWASQHPGRRAALDGIRLGLATPFDYPEFSAATAVAARVDRAVSGLPRVPARRVADRRWPRAMRPALAVAAAGLVAGAALLVTLRPSAPASPARAYTTGVGQRAVVTLADGSRVTLAPASRLEIWAGERTVALTGQAQFDVVPSAAAAFVVRTGAVATRVLGTRFDVRHYAGDTAVQVAVRSGRVVTFGRRSSAVLAAGMTGAVTDSTAVVAASDAAGAGWVDGQLIFENAPVSAVLATLERWYDYRFQVTDSAMARRRVRAAFKTDERGKALDALADLLDATVTVDGGVVTVRPRAHRSAAPVRHRERETFSNPLEVGK